MPTENEEKCLFCGGGTESIFPLPLNTSSETTFKNTVNPKQKVKL
jgi:hypothetical protein